MVNGIIGVLGIQGDFDLHIQSINRLGYDAITIRTKNELNKIDKLIIPGGESTTIRLLLQRHGLWDEIKHFAQYKPVFGTCAGAILLSKNINTGEESLNAIDIDIKRNSYGRQINSFQTTLELNLGGEIVQSSVMFVRAPQITRIGKNVTIIAKYANFPVIVQENHVIVATCHPEVACNDDLCSYFLHCVS